MYKDVFGMKSPTMIDMLLNKENMPNITESTLDRCFIYYRLSFCSFCPV